MRASLHRVFASGGAQRKQRYIELHYELLRQEATQVRLHYACRDRHFHNINVCARSSPLRSPPHSTHPRPLVEKQRRVEFTGGAAGGFDKGSDLEAWWESRRVACAIVVVVHKIFFDVLSCITCKMATVLVHADGLESVIIVKSTVFPDRDRSLR